MITAYGVEATKKKAAELGASGLVTKPIDFTLRQIKEIVWDVSILHHYSLRVRSASHDKSRQNFASSRIDRSAWRGGSSLRRSRHRHCDAGPCSQGTAKSRQISGHAEGRSV